MSEGNGTNTPATDSGTDRLTSGDRRFLTYVSNSINRARAGLAQLADLQFGGKRDLTKTFGYKQTLKYKTYLSYYERGDIAKRIVDLPPEDTWRSNPTIKVEGVPDSEFAAAVEALDNRLHLWSYLARLDRVARLGRYGVLHIGLEGDLREPVPLGEGAEGEGEGGRREVAYFSIFSEGNAEPKRFVKDTEDPRWGMPESYKLTVTRQSDGGGASTNTIPSVHWSRLIHVAEDRFEDDLYGTPALRAIVNKFDDLAKVVGGSAEMYWQIVGGFLQLNAAPEARIDTDPGSDWDKLLEDVSDAMDGLKRVVGTQGIEMSRVSGESPDPQDLPEIIMTLIAATVGIPKRILFGTERGELASSQDQREWHGRISTRREQYVDPEVIRPTLDRLVAVGALPAPEGEYEIEWQELHEQSSKEKADEGLVKAQTIQAYAPEGATDMVVPVEEFRKEILGIEPEPDYEGLGIEPVEPPEPPPGGTAEE